MILLDKLSAVGELAKAGLACGLIEEVVGTCCVCVCVWEEVGRLVVMGAYGGRT